jgi:hypothetical protein
MVTPTVSHKVKAFCAALSARLGAEHWGVIEPDVFLNLAEGNINPSPGEGFYTDTMTQDDMRNAVIGMNAILEDIVP